MIRGENSDSIPIDLIIEILSRLPAKSIMRFRCVSKLWSSMFLRPYFTDLFLTRSSACPRRFLFAVELDGDEWCFFTSPQPQNPSEESSSLVVTADVHMKFPGYESLEFCGHVSGLIYFRRRYVSNFEDYTRQVICNPCTRQYAMLPSPKERRGWRGFLGFDPIDKQFKVFSIRLTRTQFYDDEKENQYQILTLGPGNDSWRKIHCPLNHFSSYHLPEEICINGVLYYFAKKIDGGYVLVCFDVRSEKFRFIYNRDFIIYSYGTGTKLFNYKGKLGVITIEKHSLKLCMWVINDVEKQDSEWPKHFDFCWGNKVVQVSDLSIVGVSATGEIVLSSVSESTPFYVFYLNPEKNTLQSVEIQVSGANQLDNRRRVVVMVDHVEDLNFITMKTQMLQHL